MCDLFVQLLSILNEPSAMRNEKQWRTGLPVSKKWSLCTTHVIAFECSQNRKESIQMLATTTIEFAKENELLCLLSILLTVVFNRNMSCWLKRQSHPLLYEHIEAAIKENHDRISCFFDYSLSHLSFFLRKTVDIPLTANASKCEREKNLSLWTAKKIWKVSQLEECLL